MGRLHTVSWSGTLVQYVLESPHGPGYKESKQYTRISLAQPESFK